VIQRGTENQLHCLLANEKRGGAEFAGPENGGPKRSKTGKCKTWKMTDQIAGLENAGPGK